MDEVQVLIVEDEAIVSMDLRYKLESLGYSVSALCEEQSLKSKGRSTWRRAR